jgi:hypothetical protein
MLGCPITYEIRRAIVRFADENGRFWKRKLQDIWIKTDSPNAELQQFRNIAGPSRLLKITTAMLDRERNRT